MVRNRVFLVVVLSVFCAISAFAQRDLGTLTGVVTDPTGSVVPNATVTIIGEDTGQKFSVVTDSSGTYVRPLLQPGRYTVEVEAAGFRRAIQKAVPVTAGDRVGLNIQLTVGEVSQSVEVTAAAALLQTESTIVGQTLQSKLVSELPMGGQRQFTYLARLSTGVLPGESGSRDAAGGSFSANGVRSNGQNNFLLNGIDNNVNVIDFINQTAYVIGPSLEAIGEMKVLTSGYNAEYGRGAGGVVNVTLKSGTNDLHGAVYDFLQNDKLNANSWAANRIGRAKGAMRQNQFGAALGGPLIKNRTFWFIDYDGVRQRVGGAAYTATVPRAAFKNGDFSSLLGKVLGNDPLGRPVAEGQIFDITTTRQIAGGVWVRDPFPGNLIPPQNWDPVGKKLIDFYPEPNQNLTTRVPGSNYFRLRDTQKTQKDQGDARIDHRLTDKDSLFGTLSWSESLKEMPPPLPGPLDGTGFSAVTQNDQPRSAMASWSRVWNPTILTETRLAYTRLVTARTQYEPTKDRFKEFGIGGYNPTTMAAINGGLPNTSISDYTGFGAGNWIPTTEYSNVWDFVENVAVIKGKHSMKFGFEYRPIGFPFFQVESPHGTMTFSRTRNYSPTATFQGATGDSMAAFLTGYLTTGQVSTTNFISSEKKTFAFFGQTDWKVTRKLTLNLGVRYETFSPIAEKFGRQVRFDWDRQTLLIPKGKDMDTPLPSNFATVFPMVKVERGTVDKYLIPWDHTSIGPRIGLAYSLTDKTVIRAGFGIFYGGEENEGAGPNRGQAAPFNMTIVMDIPANMSAFEINPFLPRLQQGFPADVLNRPARSRLFGLDKRYLAPMVQKWNFAIQRELPGNMAWEISYIGNHQAHQVNSWDPNTAPARPDVPAGSVPSDSLRPVPIFGSVSYYHTNGFGNYAGLATKLEKRMSHGLDFIATYTWGHALANTGTPLYGGVGDTRGNPRDLRYAYTDASWDQRHNFTASFMYDMPFGRGKKLGGNMSQVADRILGGWQANGVIGLRSGRSFTLGTRYGVGYISSIHPDYVAPGRNVNNAPSAGRTPAQWFDTSAVQSPVPYTNGTVPNASNKGPANNNVDLSLFKGFQITERFRAQFRVEAMNISNSPHFGNPGGTQGDPTFGQINSASGERSVQVALRLMF
ncbi:MAG: TonB-dependent receptor [Bryobacterales bacterium]|nr:TonB-dependent receptor [Bryobacterales bacterium]